MYGLGIDSGSTTTKGVLVGEGGIVETFITPTSASPRDSIYEVYKRFCSDSVGFTVTTGYGRELLTESDKKVTEITCHAKGAAFLNPHIRAVIDIGGQDCKAISLDKDLNVSDFVMNDKCAAGTGRFVEVMMRTLGENIDGLDSFVSGRTPVNISSMCTVFAESEIVSLLAKGTPKGDIALGIIHSICRRTAFFAQKVHIEGDVFFSGGLARFAVFRDTLEKYLEHRVVTDSMSQYAGAIGAGVIAYKKAVAAI